MEQEEGSEGRYEYLKEEEAANNEERERLKRRIKTHIKDAKMPYKELLVTIRRIKIDDIPKIDIDALPNLSKIHVKPNIKTSKPDKNYITPVITIENSLIRPKSPTLRKDTPHHKIIRREALVPVMAVEKPRLDIIKPALNSKLVSISEKSVMKTEVPVVSFDNPPVLNSLITRLHDDIPKLSKKPSPTLIPKYTIEQPVKLSTIIREFDKTLPKLNVRGEEKGIEEVRSIEEGASTPSPERDGESYDFFGCLFIGEVGRIKGYGPKIIIFKDDKKDSYLHLLQQYCIRVYREVEGGKPTLCEIHTFDELGRFDLLKRLEAGDKVFTIRLDEDELRQALLKEQTRIKGQEERDYDKLTKHLRERLTALRTQNTGCIIFYSRDDETFNRVKKLIERINAAENFGLDIVVLQANPIPTELWQLTAKLISGREPSKKLFNQVLGFDSLINNMLFKGESEINQKYKRIMKERNGLFKMAVNRHKDESPEHYNIKVFIVRYLTKELEKKGWKFEIPEDVKERIKTEEQEDNVKPDVLVNDEGRVYEVETLFGEGYRPEKAIDDLINKYKDLTWLNELNIVIDNFGFILHLEDLLKYNLALRKSKERGRWRFDVNFLTLDLDEDKLISLEEITEHVKKLIMKIRSLQPQS